MRDCLLWALFTNVVAFFVETLQVRPQLHEGSGLGRGGCTSAGVGQEGWRTYK